MFFIPGIPDIRLINGIRILTCVATIAILSRVLNFLLITREDLQHKVQETFAITDHSLFQKAWEELYDYFVCWLSSRSVGLLEISTEDGKTDIWKDEVVFTHRSAKEFLLGTPDGAEIMSFDNRTPKERWLGVAKGSRTSAFISLMPVEVEIIPKGKCLEKLF